MFRSLWGRSASRSSTVRPLSAVAHTAQVRPIVEQLERREVPAITFTESGTEITVSITGGDTASFQDFGGNLKVTGTTPPSSVISSNTLAQITKVTVTGAGGTQTVALLSDLEFTNTSFSGFFIHSDIENFTQNTFRLEIAAGVIDFEIDNQLKINGPVIGVSGVALKSNKSDVQLDGNITVSAGNLSIVAKTGIGQGGTKSIVAGSVSATVSTSGDISLGGTNQISGLFTATNSASAGIISFRETSADGFTAGAISTSNGAISLNAENGPLTLSGNLTSGTAGQTIQAKEGINQSAGILSGKTLTATNGSGTGNINLDKNNQISGQVTLTNTVTDGSITFVNNLPLLLGNVSVAGSGSISLTSKGNMSQSAGTSLTGNTLSVTNTDAGVGTIILTEAGNNVATFSAFNSALNKQVEYTDANDLSIGTVSTNNGKVALKATAGVLTLSANIVAGGGEVLLTASNGINQIGGVIAASGIAARNGAVSGNISLTENNLVTKFAAENTFPGGDVAFVDGGGGVTVGTVDGLDGISVTGGDADVTITALGGLLDITKAITGVDDLSLIAGGGITQSGSGTITSNILAVQNSGAGNVELTLANSVITFAGSNTVAGGKIHFTDGDGFTVGTLGSVVGVSTAAGEIALTASSGALTLTQNISSGTAPVNLTAKTGISQTAGGILSGELKAINTGASGSITLSSSTNATTSFKADNSAPGQPITFNNAVNLLVDDVTANLGQIDISSAGTLTVLAGAEVKNGGSSLISMVSIDNLSVNGTVESLGGIINLTSTNSSISLNSASILDVGNVSGIINLAAKTGILQAVGSQIKAKNLSADLSGSGNIELVSGTNTVDVLAAEITPGTGSFFFRTLGNLKIGTVNGIDGVRTDNGAIVIRAADLDITKQLKAIGNTVDLSRSISGTIAVGAGAAAMLIDSAEIALVNAKRLTIGDSVSTTALSVGAALTPPNVSELVLNAGTGAITQVAGTITVPSLGLLGTTGIGPGIPLSVNVDNLAFNNNGVGAVKINALKTVTLANLGGSLGSSVNQNGEVSITAVTNGTAIVLGTSLSASDNILLKTQNSVLSGENIILNPNVLLESKTKSVNIFAGDNVVLNSPSTIKAALDLNITAVTGALTIGSGSSLKAGQDLDIMTAGSINIGTGVSVTAGTEICLKSTTGSIAVSGAVAPSIGLNAQTGINASLGVSNLAATTVLGDIVITNSKPVTIGSACGIFGLSAPNGVISFTNTNGSVTVTENILSFGKTEVKLFAGDLTLNGGKKISAATGPVSISVFGNLTLNAGSSIKAVNQQVDVIADKLDSVAGSSISAGSAPLNLTLDQINLAGTGVGNVITVVARTPPRPIELGSTNDAGALAFTDAELDNLLASDILRIGSTLTASPILLAGTVSIAVPVVALKSGANIQTTPGASISATNLAAEAKGSLTLAGNINQIAAKVGIGQGITLTTFNPALTIGTVDGLVGLKAPSGLVSLNNVTGTTTQTLDGTIVTNQLTVAGGTYSLTSANLVSSLQGTTIGNVDFVNFPSLPLTINTLTTKGLNATANKGIVIAAPVTATFGSNIFNSAEISLSSTAEIKAPISNVFNGGVIVNQNATVSSSTNTFNGSINGPAGITINSTTKTDLLGTVGGIVPVDFLKVPLTGATVNLLGNVQTQNGQLYNSLVVLNNIIPSYTLTNLTGTTQLALNAGVLGPVNSLTVNAPGVSQIISANLANLTTDAAGTSCIGGKFTISGATVLNDAVELCADTSITTATANFASTIDSVADAGFSLSLAYTNTAFIGGDIGSKQKVAALAISGGSLLTVGGESVSTSASQKYSAPSAFTKSVVSFASGGDVTFTNTAKFGGGLGTLKLNGVPNFTANVPGSALAKVIGTASGNVSLVDSGDLTLGSLSAANVNLTFGTDTPTAKFSIAPGTTVSVLGDLIVRAQSSNSTFTIGNVEDRKQTNKSNFREATVTANRVALVGTSGTDDYSVVAIFSAGSVIRINLPNTLADVQLFEGANPTIVGSAGDDTLFLARTGNTTNVAYFGGQGSDRLNIPLNKEVNIEGNINTQEGATLTTNNSTFDPAVTLVIFANSVDDFEKGFSSIVFFSVKNSPDGADNLRSFSQAFGNLTVTAVATPAPPGVLLTPQFANPFGNVNVSRLISFTLLNNDPTSEEAASNFILTVGGPGQLPVMSLQRVSVIPTGTETNGIPDQRLDFKQVANELAYEDSFRGGVFVASGDFDGDSIPEIVIAADQGGGPRIRILTLVQTGPDNFTFIPWTGSSENDFFVYDPSFRGGVRITTADVDNDGFDELITGAGVGGGPHVRIFRFDFESRRLVDSTSFFAYDPSFRGGIFVAGGNLDGQDGEDIATAPGIGGGPHIRVWSITNNFAAPVRETMLDFYASFPSDPNVKNDPNQFARNALPSLIESNNASTQTLGVSSLAVADPTGSGGGNSFVLAGSGIGQRARIRIWSATDADINISQGIADNIFQEFPSAFEGVSISTVYLAR